jgi:hypothetical protein
MTPLESCRKWVSDNIAAGKTSAVLNDPNCMLPDIPAVSCTGGRGAMGHTVTLVHPQIVEYSMHHPTSPSWQYKFGEEMYTVTKTFAPGVPDIGFGLLDRPVVGVKPLRTLLNPTADLLNLPAFWYCLRGNRLQLVEVQNWKVKMTTYPDLVITLALPTNVAWRLGTTLIGGDSSSPLIAMLDGEPVLLGTAYSRMSCSGIHCYYAWARDIWKTQFGIDAGHQTITMKIADANDDNVVDFKDFIILSNNYGKKTEKGHNVGDFDLDGDVDFTDFICLSQNFGK